MAAVLLTAACAGGGQDEEPESPLDEAEAGERVAAHIEDAVAALPGDVELEEVGNGRVSAACDTDPLITVNEAYFLRGLPEEDNEENVDLLVEHWEASGFTVTDDLRPDDVFVSVVNDEDGFTMSVAMSKQGSLSIDATSPCIHPSGTD
ncbi:hypothetical protein O4J56_10590 [Nocardiopsis sp. RSe5-2]|uniref:LppA-like lipoprotein n=1 Tax=Nocardiopsis endophytica TaxID=3018445 RepID=A0ABT4U3N2_9ACTN|nr:hypothetical protein [Nocardiopsis endophytica]MDA2811084.1 hypothetical protein [Nocardiopsis endophytica]